MGGPRAQGFYALPGGGAQKVSARFNSRRGRLHAFSSQAVARIGLGVFEIALRFRGDAYRVVYAVRLGDAIWVVHAFQKKSTQGIKTPKHEIDLLRARLKRLKEGLQ